MPKKAVKTDPTAPASRIRGAGNEVKTETVAAPRETGKLAVVELSGHQFLVREGETLEIDNQDLKVGDKFTVSEVLLLEDGGKVSVGQPYVTGCAVELEVLENKKGKKRDINHLHPSVLLF